MATATEIGEIVLYGDISSDDGISAAQFKREMDSLRDADEVHLRINSGGGSVIEGLAMIETIRSAQRRGQIVAGYNDGGALSMAAVLQAACRPSVMGESSLIMLHSPFALDGGDARELRQKADTLDKVNEQLKDVISSRTNQPRSIVEAWMAPGIETWFNAREAVSFGLADQISTERSPYASRLDDILSCYKVPERYKSQLRGPVEQAVQEVENCARWGRRAITHSGYEMYKRDVILGAGKVIKMPGATRGDIARVAAAIDHVKESEDWPREIYRYC